jgi:hypothetical protein
VNRDAERAARARQDVTWMLGRMTDRTYIHRTFPLPLERSKDYGLPARFVVKVFDESLLARAEWHVEVAEREESPWDEPEPRGGRRTSW